MRGFLRCQPAASRTSTAIAPTETCRLISARCSFIAAMVLSRHRARRLEGKEDWSAHGYPRSDRNGVDGLAARRKGSAAEAPSRRAGGYRIDETPDAECATGADVVSETWDGPTFSVPTSAVQARHNDGGAMDALALPLTEFASPFRGHRTICSKRFCQRSDRAIAGPRM